MENIAKKIKTCPEKLSLKNRDLGQTQKLPWWEGIEGERHGKECENSFGKHR